MGKENPRKLLTFSSRWFSNIWEIWNILCEQKKADDFYECPQELLPVFYFFEELHINSRERLTNWKALQHCCSGLLTFSFGHSCWEGVSAFAFALLQLHRYFGLRRTALFPMGAWEPWITCRSCGSCFPRGRLLLLWQHEEHFAASVTGRPVAGFFPWECEHCSHEL